LTEFIDDQIPMPAAMSVKQLKVKSLMWPCSQRLDPGTPVLYKDQFATRSGKASLAVPKRAASEPAQSPAGGALMATVGFGLFPYRSGTLSRQSYALSRVEPDPRLHLSPADAARLGIADQMPVQVTIQGMDNAEPVYAVSLVYERIPEGRAFLAFTMQQAGTNRSVREARRRIQAGPTKAIPISVQPAPHMTVGPASELQPVATANVLDTGRQPL
jgi:predicted molibdopterin-dependent oxidoreductase YjgC